MGNLFDAVLFFEYLEGTFDIERLRRRFELATDIVFENHVPFEYADSNLYNEVFEVLEEYAEDYELSEEEMENIDLEDLLFQIFDNLK